MVATWTRHLFFQPQIYASNIFKVSILSYWLLYAFAALTFWSTDGFACRCIFSGILDVIIIIVYDKDDNVPESWKISTWRPLSSYKNHLNNSALSIFPALIIIVMLPFYLSFLVIGDRCVWMEFWGVIHKY